MKKLMALLFMLALVSSPGAFAQNKKDSSKKQSDKKTGPLVCTKLIDKCSPM